VRASGDPSGHHGARGASTDKDKQEGVDGTPPGGHSVDYAEQQRNPGKHVVGFGIVILMHLLLGWALVSGLARQIVAVIKAPIETKIIEEVKPPPPPPPENLPPPPKFAPPPPSFVPPPEINVNPPPTPAPTITTTQVAPPPAPVAIAPPPAPAAPPAAPAPPAPPRVPVRVEPKLDFNVCAKPEYNAAARRAEAQGTVVVVYTMDTSGDIKEATVEKSAGPSREHKMLDRLTLEAVTACKGKPGSVDGKPEKLTSRVTYVWKLTD
jgi:protein TonB